MCVSIRRFPEHNLSLAEIRGVLTSPELLDFLNRLEVAEGTLWLTYIHPDADLSRLDLMSLTQAKRAVAAAVDKGRGDGAFRSAFVCASPVSEPVITLWSNYLGRDLGHPSKPEVFSELGAACRRLGLSAAAQEDVARMLRPGAQKPTTA